MGVIMFSLLWFMYGICTIRGHGYTLLAKSSTPAVSVPLQTLVVTQIDGECSFIECGIHCEGVKKCLSFSVTDHLSSDCQCLLYQDLVTNSSNYVHTENTVYYGISSIDCFESSCYIVEPFTSVNWGTADTYCKDKEGRLVSVETPDEQDYIRSLVYALTDGTVLYRMYTGLVEGSNGTWYWSHNNEVMAYDDWGLYEPQPNEPCMGLQISGDNFWWINIHCTANQGLVCEIDGKPSD